MSQKTAKPAFIDLIENRINISRKTLEVKKNPAIKIPIPNTREISGAMTPMLINFPTSPNRIIPPMIRYPVAFMKHQKESQNSVKEMAKLNRL